MTVKYIYVLILLLLCTVNAMVHKNVTVVTSAKEVMFHLCLSVCLSPGLFENY